MYCKDKRVNSQNGRKYWLPKALCGSDCVITLADVDRFDDVVKTRLFQEHRNLVTVRRGSVIKVNHASYPSGFKTLIGGE